MINIDGNRFLIMMFSLGLSYRQLAKAIGCSQQGLAYNVKVGRISPEKAAKIEEVFGVPVSYYAI